MDLFSLPFFMEYSNGRLLQLIECIESIKSDVKKKMMLTRARDPYTKVTRDGKRRNLFGEQRRDQRRSTDKCVTLPSQQHHGVVQGHSSPPLIGFRKFQPFRVVHIYNWEDEIIVGAHEWLL